MIELAGRAAPVYGMPEGWTTPPLAAGDGVPVVRNLVYARQSGVGAQEDLKSMLQRTLMLYPELEGWSEIRAAGLDPLLSPGKFPDACRWPLPDYGSAALWSVGSTSVLYALGSATASNLEMGDSEEENAVSALLRSVVRDIKPHTVFVGRFDRAVRAFKHSSKTFEALRHHAKYFRHDDGIIDLRSPNAEAEWQRLTVEASQNHKTTHRKMTSGKFNGLLNGQWTMSRHQTPVGFKVGPEKYLQIEPAEHAIIKEIVLALADPGYNKSDLVTRLALTWDIPYRVRPPASRGRQIHDKVWAMPEYDYAHRWVGRVLDQLPDLAQGKYVCQHTQPSTLDAAYAAARIIDLENGRYAHRLVVDVEDLFEGISDELLARAVRLAVEHRISHGLAGSDWLAETAARERMREIGPQTELEIAWAGRQGQLIDEMGKRPARRPWVADVVRTVEQGADTPKPRPTKHKQAMLLAGYPVWRDGEFEFFLQAVSGSYAVLRRPIDKTLSPEKSARRPWYLTNARVPNERVGVCSGVELHETIARLAAEAIETGVPYLRDEHGLTSVLARRLTGNVVPRALEITTLENALTRQRRRARLASEDLRSRREEDQALRDGITHINGRALRAVPAGMLQDAEEAAIREWERTAQLETELEALRAAPVVRPDFEVPEDDLELLAGVLARLGSILRADKRTIADVRRVLPTFKITAIDDISLHFEFSVAIPLTSVDGIVLGPIRGRVRQNGKARVDGTSRAYAVARALCVEEVTEGGLGELQAYSVRGPRRNMASIQQAAQIYLHDQVGMSRPASSCLLTCPLPRVRALIWAIAHDESLEPFQDLDPAYVMTVRRAYFDNPSLKKGPYSPTTGMRHAALRELIEAGGTDRLSLVAKRLGMGQSGLVTLRKMLIENHFGHSVEPASPPDGEEDKRPGRPGGWYSVRKCTHCGPNSGSVFDIAVLVPEIPSGLLCSSCLHSPDPNSPTYPAEYRDLPDLLFANADKVTQGETMIAS
ncbi:MAG TPA: hypothetical protein VHO26_06920 [Propionibacteriaceae bacterium]|nr:hypothetical protein [Propionibacteriaceae bacterium]